MVESNPDQINTSERNEEVKGGEISQADVPQEKKLSGIKVKLVPKDSKDPTELELEIA